MRCHRFLLAVSLLLFPVVVWGQAKPQPATLRSILLEELRTTHNQADWFVPVNTAVAGLSAEQARWVPPSTGPGNAAPADHSVGMLAYHLLFWNQRALHTLQGNKPADFKGDNKETFNQWDASSWGATVRQLDEVLAGLEQVVATADEARLQSMASEVAHIATHNAYHTGQIVEIRKLQGTWNPDKGVK